MKYHDRERQQRRKYREAMIKKYHRPDDEIRAMEMLLEAEHCGGYFQKYNVVEQRVEYLDMDGSTISNDRAVRANNHYLQGKKQAQEEHHSIGSYKNLITKWIAK